MATEKEVDNKGTDSAGQKEEVTWETTIEMVCPNGHECVMSAREIKEKIVPCDRCDKHCPALACEICQAVSLIPSAHRHFKDFIAKRCISSPRGEDLRKADRVISLVCSGA